MIFSREIQQVLLFSSCSLRHTCQKKKRASIQSIDRRFRFVETKYFTLRKKKSVKINGMTKIRAGIVFKTFKFELVSQKKKSPCLQSKETQVKRNQVKKQIGKCRTIIF